MEKPPLNKTPALMKSMDMDIRVVGTSNHSFEEVLKLKPNFQKLTRGYWQSSILWGSSILLSPI